MLRTRYACTWHIQGISVIHLNKKNFNIDSAVTAKQESQSCQIYFIYFVDFYFTCVDLMIRLRLN